MKRYVPFGTHLLLRLFIHSVSIFEVETNTVTVHPNRTFLLCCGLLAVPRGSRLSCRLSPRRHARMPTPGPMPDDVSRLLVRLSQLSCDQLTSLVAKTSHERLVKVVASLVAQESDVCRAAEEALRAKAPVEAYARVFESPDLVTIIMSKLTLEDYAATAVCSLWLRCWKATRHLHGLRESEICTLRDLGLRTVYSISSGADFCYISGEVEPQLGSPTSEGIAVVDHCMQLVRMIRVVEGAPYYGDMPIAASEVGLYMAVHDDPVQVTRLPLLAQTSERFLASSIGSLDSPHLFNLLTCWQSGLLYATVRRGQDGPSMGSTDSIAALDLKTLEVRFFFGAGVVENPRAIAVVDNELYIGGSTPGVLHVFSLEGKPLRNIVGTWRVPWALAYAKGRLYLIEDAWREAVEPEDDAVIARAKRRAGRCIIVLAPEDGHVLQVFQPAAMQSAGADSAEQADVFVSMSEFRGRLICAMASEDSERPSSAVITVFDVLDDPKLSLSL